MANFTGSLFADLIVPGNIQIPFGTLFSTDLLTGDDTINGAGGNDTIDGGDGNDTINGGDGFDTIIGAVGNDTINGDQGDELIYGDYQQINLSLPDGLLLTSMGRTAGATIWRIRNGFDTPKTITFKAYRGPIIYSGLVAANTDFYIASSVTAGAATHLLFDDLGNQIGVKASGNQPLSGFDDSISGGIGNDTIFGGLGTDTINGDAGDDSIFGDDGDDSLSGGINNDALFGALGNDTINGDAGNDSIFGDDGDDSLSGGFDNDTLFGALGSDTLNGDRGDDSLVGGNGDDFLNGSNGNDILVGGIGSDDITGGSGTDTFVYGGAIDSNAGTLTIPPGSYDTLGSFSVVNDKIDTTYSPILLTFAGNLAGTLATATTTAASTIGINDIGYFQFGGDTYVLGNDGSLTVDANDLLIQLNGSLTLTAANFV